MIEITPKENTSAYEVADIFRLYGQDYLSKNKLTRRQYAVMSAVQNCRTASYGYHVDQCSACGHIEQAFNSCRDRHCPKCQGISRKKWIDARLKDILPVPYYHAVFTLPHFLNNVISYNKRVIYELLLSSSSETLLTFGRDTKWLGGEIGFYGILHTWGQTLWPHVHVHYVVAGGALSDGGRWIKPEHDDKFLFPVHALSKVFRGKFIQGLKAAFACDRLKLPQRLSHLSAEDRFEHWIDQLVSRNWVVYCKRPFADAASVVRYIGRYTHRVAISNNRIIDVKNNDIRFLYKDYKASRVTWRQIALKSDEFIRRFIWHVLPNRFHKIRHYGFLANGRCRSKLKQIREILSSKAQDQFTPDESVAMCPNCGKGELSPVMILRRIGYRVFCRFFVANPCMAYDTS